MVSYKGKNIKLIKHYFNEYVDQLGDLKTYNVFPREVEFNKEHKVHFTIKWLNLDTVELYMTIYNSNNELVTSSWVVGTDNDWTIIPY